MYYLLHINSKDLELYMYTHVYIHVYVIHVYSIRLQKRKEKIAQKIGKASRFLFVNLTFMPVKIGTYSSLFSINFKEDQNQGASI